MSLLIVGLSHRTAPVSVLERTAVSGSELTKVLDELMRAESISEVMVLSTCNRLEVYADVVRFHPAVAEVTGTLARHSGLPVADLGDHLYVHFAEAAAEHAFMMAAGLDSMVVGESQILGQLRVAYAAATAESTVGTVLHEVVQTALRIGKRAHSDTGIDKAGASVVSVALDTAETVIGPLAARRAVIVGAGSMGALTGATLRRRGVSDIVVVNRSVERGRRLAENLGGRYLPVEEIRAAIAAADVLISSTGSTGLVVGVDDVLPRTTPLVVLDIALPRDVDSAVGDLPDVTYLDLDSLRAAGAMVSDTEVAAATAIVTDELAAYLSTQLQLAVAPTVTALRARAAEVVDAELARLDHRLPDLDAAMRAEVGDAVRRAVEKVLHAPTVRVKELAATPGGDQYAAALRELFDLDPARTEAVTAVRRDRS